MRGSLAASIALLLSAICFTQASQGPFDVRQYLSTTTRYGAGKVIEDNLAADNVVPPAGCTPIHLNLVARHGTRAPTKKRIKEMDQLAERLKALADSSPRAPVWLKVWQSPWKGRKVGGELLIQGEEEMFQLGTRVNSNFSEIFKDDYHPDFYLMTTTQVPRSAASGVAFGMGLLAGKGTLGPGLQRAFAVISDSRLHDIHLRFHETCQTYKESKEKRKPVVASFQEEVYVQISASLVERFKLNITSTDVPSLWFLCKQEAALQDIVDQACGLFTREEVELLEWADDLELHHLKGYGESINYRMGVPLLDNVLKSMEQAVLASKGAEVPNSVERARLRFAHAETVIPFTCLLGLFLDGSDVKKILSEQPLDPPPRPPKQRSWRGSSVAPYGANTMLILYKCSGNKEAITESGDEFLVQVFHNEKPVTMPACNGTHFCPFKNFKEDVALPHLRYSYESLCTVKKIDSSCSWSCWFSKIGSQLFKLTKQTESCEDKSEL